MGTMRFEKRVNDATCSCEYMLTVQSSMTVSLMHDVPMEYISDSLVGNAIKTINGYDRSDNYALENHDKSDVKQVDNSTLATMLQAYIQKYGPLSGNDF